MSINKLTLLLALIASGASQQNTFAADQYQQETTQTIHQDRTFHKFYTIGAFGLVTTVTSMLHYSGTISTLVRKWSEKASDVYAASGVYGAVSLGGFTFMVAFLLALIEDYVFSKWIDKKVEKSDTSFSAKLLRAVGYFQAMWVGILMMLLAEKAEAKQDDELTNEDDAKMGLVARFLSFYDLALNATGNDVYHYFALLISAIVMELPCGLLYHSYFPSKSRDLSAYITKLR